MSGGDGLKPGHDVDSLVRELAEKYLTCGSLF